MLLADFFFWVVANQHFLAVGVVLHDFASDGEMPLEMIARNIFEELDFIDFCNVLAGFEEGLSFDIDVDWRLVKPINVNYLFDFDFCDYLHWNFDDFLDKYFFFYYGLFLDNPFDIFNLLDFDFDGNLNDLRHHDLFDDFKSDRNFSDDLNWYFNNLYDLHNLLYLYNLLCNPFDFLKSFDFDGNFEYLNLMLEHAC
jgi:hypothetical protein